MELRVHLALPLVALEYALEVASIGSGWRLEVVELLLVSRPDWLEIGELDVDG